jgi:hypothetical protein
MDIFLEQQLVIKKLIINLYYFFDPGKKIFFHGN